MRSVFSGAAVLVAAFAMAIPAHGDPADPPLPGFRELEAMGATIGAIRIDPRNIFDTADSREDNILFRAANAMHVTTRRGVVENLLLFKPGERVSARLIDETERLLHANRIFYDATIRPTAYRDGVVDIEVVTRDTWTLDVAGKLSRSGGSNSTSFGIKEYNLLGTGARLGISRTSSADRSGAEYEVAYPRAFGGSTDFDYLQGSYDDGSRRSASVRHPFISLDTRWAAEVAWDRWSRVDSIHNAGDVIAQYRHENEAVDLFAGWSPGNVRGWTRRYSIGATMQDHRYGTLADSPAPATMPVDHEVRGPWLRFELIEDRYLKVRNRDQIARTEFVAMGLIARLQATRALGSWGSDRPAWLYSATVSNGFVLGPEHDLLARAAVERRIGSSGEPFTQVGASLRYFRAQGTHTAFHASIAGDRVGRVQAPDLLEVGGDSGLRGYPQHYQSGDKRVVFTLEQRVYSDWYPFRLVRVGGAVFYDLGRAWGGVNPNRVNGGWLSDAGIGLRLLLDRASFAKVLHADIAMPLDRAGGIKAVQYHVRTELTF